MFTFTTNTDEKLDFVGVKLISAFLLVETLSLWIHAGLFATSDIQSS